VQTHATDASVAQPTDALSSVCCSSRTRQTCLSLTRKTRCPAFVARTCATCLDHLKFTAFAPTASDVYVTIWLASIALNRRGTESMFAQDSDERVPYVPDRRMLASDAPAPHERRDHPRDRRGNSGQPSVCRSTTTASDGSRARATATVSRQMLGLHLSLPESASIASNTSDFQFFVALLVSPFHI
jgi:hypothetical protein